MFVLFQPVWLLLLVPLAAACFVWRLPGRGLIWLRGVVLLAVVLALAQLALRLPDRAGTVIVVADRSDSMPPDSASSEKEIIRLLHKSMGPRDQLGVVSFGREAMVEQSPQHAAFGGFATHVGGDHSSLNAAMESALSLIPSDGGGRILLLSDGRWTGPDPAAAAARAAGRSVAVDYRLMARSPVSDVAVESLQVPPSLQPGQAFVVSAWVRCPSEQEIRYQLRRGDDILAAGAKLMSAGLNRLMFRDRAGKSGVAEYTLTVQGGKDDPVPENNSARALTGIEGSKPLLVVSAAGENSSLVKLLRAGLVEVEGRRPTQCQWSLEQLSRYSGVLLENVPAGQIGMAGMSSLAAWTEDSGGGLALTGGQKSYGPGGYFHSPLERVLPISMEMRREHRKLNLAVVVALDRSGSMSASAGGGRIKMDLADLGTAQVLDLLSPLDEIGVFAVDTTPHEIVALDTVENNRAYRSKILSIGSQGGGIYIYEALVAAARMIMTSKAQTRHIILFADAADSEQSMHYEEIVEKLRNADVTVSVIGLGTDHDVDANLLRDIALRGGGDCYFTDNPDEIPRIFAQDTFTVARSTFIDQPTPFSFTAGFSLLGSPPVSVPPSLGGYNLCYLRPEANLAAVTGDEYQAPVVASWNAGNGRVLCYLGEADGKFSGDVARWKEAGEFYATLARWIAGRRPALPDDLLLTQEIRDGTCFLQLHLDPERKADPFTGLPRVKVLHGLPGAPPQRASAPLQWKSADLLEAAVPVAGGETMLNTVEIPGLPAVGLAPVCLPYSPEFAPEQPGRGAATLARIATTTGGRERVEIPKIWQELPVKSRYVELAPWLFAFAAVMFLVEIFERRTGWLSRILPRRKGATIAATKDEREEISETPASSAASAAQPKTSVPSATQTKTPTTPAGDKSATPPSEGKESGTLDALREARDRAKRR